MPQAKARSGACQVALVISLVAAGGLQLSCSTNTAPQPGTPAFYWAGAQEAFAAGELLIRLLRRFELLSFHFPVGPVA